jgi:hypothetical protein
MAKPVAANLFEGQAAIGESGRLDREPRGITMSAEADQVLLALAEGVVDVKVVDASGGAFACVFTQCDKDGGPVIQFD